MVLVKDVVFDAATPAEKANFTGTSNGVSLSMRNNYQIESVPAGTYDVTIVVTIHNNAPSLYVVNYTSKTSGIETVEDSAEADIEYYNLHGFKVVNPAHGLYIRVADGKATKLIL